MAVSGIAVSGLMARLDTVGEAVRAALAAASLDLAEALRDAVADTAPRRDGRLAGSFAVTAGDDGTSAEVGSTLPYAGFQEFGFAGVEQVAAHLRRHDVAFGMPMAPREVLVRAHQRRIAYAGRHFIAAALDGMADDIRAGYADALTGALGG